MEQAGDLVGVGDRSDDAKGTAASATDAPVVRVTVELEGGQRVERCRCERARLIARRVIGLPVGIDALRVHCTDDAGKHHDGDVVYRAIDDGTTYEPG